MRRVPALAITILLASLAVGAQQGGGAQQQPAGRTPPKALVPVAASSLLKNPDAFYGEWVSLAAPVEQTVSKFAFSVDPDSTKPTGNEVLVLMRHVSGTVDPNTYVTVVGEVVRFEPDELAAKAKEYLVDLPGEVAAKFRGRPAILALNVVNAAGVDVTRRLPPPMTAAEEALSKLMKQVSNSNNAIRKAMEGSDVKLARENAIALRQTFAEVETFWRRMRRQDAVGWAADARKLAENIDRSAAAGKWDEVKAHAGTLGKTCQTCHSTYRERFDDGSFRIKKPGTTN